mmetsp:Transcript_14356/g.21514  ORF Transcript_14356/g.21514 Transcript_14356/m.21514 type:complete len:726 (-) Transcript_14356:60-2237(-)
MELEGSCFMNACIRVKSTISDLTSHHPFRRARTNFLSLDSYTVDNVLPIFKDVWEELTKQPLKSPLYMPPLFLENEMLSEMVECLVHLILVRLNSLEKFDTGHGIIGGIEGTGKTTIVKALVVAVAICCPTFMILYFNYKRASRSPKSLVCEFAIRYYNRDFDGFFGDSSTMQSTSQSGYSILMKQTVGKVLSVVARGNDEIQGMSVGLVADEFQALLVKGAVFTDERVEVVRQMEEFAKHYIAALVIITVSSSTFRECLYNSLYPGIDYVNYPDFNKSLFSYFHVAALRTVKELDQFVRKRYSGKPQIFEDKYLAECMHSTGGIGQNIHVYISNGLTLPRAVSPADAIRDPTSRFYVLAALIRKYNTPASGSKLEAAISSWKHQQKFFITPTDVGIDISNAVREMALRKFPYPLQSINQYVDSGLLYVSHDSNLTPVAVQLARPADAEFYYGSNVSPDDFLRLDTIRLSVYRPELGVAAGDALENLLRTRVHTLIQNCDPFNGTFIKVDNNNSLAFCSDLRRSCWEPVTVSSIQDYIGNRLLILENETGVYGVILTLQQNVQGKVVIGISIWQCMSGALSAEVGGGSMDTYRNQLQYNAEEDFLGMSTAFHKDDKYIAETVTRAEAGFMKLIRSILFSIPDIYCQVESLLITTTKGDTSSAQSMLKNCGSRQSIPSDTLAKVVGGINDGMARISNSQYSIILYSGDSWVAGLLEPVLADVWGSL